MRIEAITVCVDYDDFLHEIAPYNIPHLDRWIIVTRSKDEKTREVCRKYSLECLLIDDNLESFNKGRIIERALCHVSSEGWRLHLDSDIVLPNRFKSLLETSELQTDCIYGCDRVLIKSWESWQTFVKSNFLSKQHHDYHCRLRFPQGYDIGSRWVDISVGYCPIGFFQLWHSNSDQWHGINYRKYPEYHNTACRTDVQFSQKWDRNKRILLPDIVVFHLESEIAKLGANWNGRKTKRFGPDNINSSNSKAIS